MAHNLRIPSLLWKTASGNVTLSLVDCPVAKTTVATGREEAFKEMSAYLEAYADEYGINSLEPDLEEIQVRHYNVSCPSRYYTGLRIYNTGFEVRVRVPAIIGAQASGGYLCVIPSLNLRFDFHSESEERTLAQHFIKTALQSLPPRILSTMYAETDAELVDVVVRIKEKVRGTDPNDLETYGVLASVAEPVIRGRGLRAKYPAAWGLEWLVKEILNRLEETTQSIVLVGEPGCGKTTAIVDAALQLAERRGERSKPICWRTSAHRLIAGMRYLGQWEQRCEEVIGILESFKGVLCVEDLIGLVRTGGTEPISSVAAFLMPFISRGELRLIGESTPGQLEACRRLLPGFCDLFQIMPMPRLSSDGAISILQRISEGAFQRSKTEVAPGVENLHNRLHEKFLSYETPPGKLVRSFRQILDRAAEQKQSTIGPGDVLAAFSREAGLPPHLLDDGASFGFEEAHAYFQSRIIGQSAACDSAANVVATFKAGLQDPERPLAVLLFCGPTGVGKTAMAKAISECLFGAGEDRDRLIRLDMSEYGGYDAVSRLLGVPGGEPSQLISKVRTQPFQVILLDEIEKASPAIYDVLLNAFDEGRLREADGRDTYFRNAIFILTSNLGVTGKSEVGFGGEESQVNYTQEAMRFFRPEFVNRLDEIVSFSPLSQESIRRIAESELNALAEREGLKERGISVEWGDETLEKVAAAGFDPRYGARPLQRAVEEYAVAPIALYLAENPELRNARLRILQGRAERVN